MEPFTHALVSLGIARAGQRRLPRFGILMLVVAGVLPDLDYLSYVGGASVFLRLHRAVFHSVVGGAALACVLAAAFCALDKKLPAKVDARRRFAPLTFRDAAAICGAGVLAHILLDMTSSVGVQLVWPFYTRWFGWPLTAELDLWMLILLAAGLLLPLLFKLVNEEVGERKKGTGQRGAAITLALLVVYLGARADFRAQAIHALLLREYHGEIPLEAGAFPSSGNPFAWRGVVVTDNTIEEIEGTSGAGAEFDTERSLTHYKPGESEALDAAEDTAAARRFIRYAKLPLAMVARREAGYRVEIRDMRFPSDDTGPDNIFVLVDLDSGARVTRQALRFAAAGNP